MEYVEATPELIKKFQALSPIEQQIIWIQAICNPHMREDSYRNELAKKLKISFANYQAIKEKLIQIGFGKKKTLRLSESLSHQLLLLLPEGTAAVETTRVINALYGCYFTDFSEYYANTRTYESSGAIRVCLTAALYANDEHYFLKAPNLIYCHKLSEYVHRILSAVSLGQKWLQSRKPAIQAYICISLLSSYYCTNAIIAANNLNLVKDLFCENTFGTIHNDYVLYYAAILHGAMGHLDKMNGFRQRISDKKSGFDKALRATEAFFKGEFLEAESLYTSALAEMRKYYRSRNYYFDNILGVFYGLCSIARHKKLSVWLDYETAYDKYRERKPGFSMELLYQLLSVLALISEGDIKNAQPHLAQFTWYFESEPNSIWNRLFFELAHFLIDPSYIQSAEKQLLCLIKMSEDAELVAASIVAYELLSHHASYAVKAKEKLSKMPYTWRLFSLLEIKQPWEHALVALENLLIPDALEATIQPKRILWLLNLSKKEVEVVEQSLSKKGTWNKGRVVSIEKLYRQEVDCLSVQDKEVIANAIVADDQRWFGVSYQFDFDKLLWALCDHPNVAYLENKERSIQFLAIEPELHIEEKKGAYHISLSHYASTPGVMVENRGVGQYGIVNMTQSYVAIAQIVGAKGVALPVEAKDKVLRVIQNAKHDIKIHVEMDETGLTEVTGDATPYIQLLPVAEGIRASLLVKPLSDNEGAYFKAAQGKENMIMLVARSGIEERIRVKRNFSEEKKQQKQFLKHCTQLAAYEEQKNEYHVESAEEVLELLSALRTYADQSPLVVEWPKGESFKIKQQISAGKIAFNIRSQQNWFEYDGQLSLDDGTVLPLKELLQALNAETYGRFIRLSDGAFLELTAQFQKQLMVLRAISDGQRLNPLAAQVLSDLVSEASAVAFDVGWEKHVEKIKTMQSYVPKLPTTLQANLRDYQLEGFHYLSKLSHWGIGACLADDMGLGKTVQAIALLLEQAKQGPALVLAPTSVCFNWLEELNKFAPTLKAINLRDDKRASLIDEATTFNVVVCSYGLLQHNEALLINKSWQSIILDEAQAIKNAQTKRWRAVMKLKAQVRIALSGTPIENHLGELWSIFSFLTPSLLGSIQVFQNKYVTPIENGSEEKLLALKTLVQPYILRRLKTEVLSELPSKTEQTIHVEPTVEEAAFYEALRRIAEERVSQFVQENNRISALAEITKLRLACCDSSLVNPTISIGNSKLKSFMLTLHNILDNGHKALVFSQYVSFLKIVQKHIIEAGISHQYLDGSTSVAARKKAVEAFQGGEGDVFLLSLKAGGSGLNLTAADYVIHLDPWWNPAVEDQASDRAHRIGQQRPVTVYRFVMQNTIEEKIIQLHQRKRDLADDLLSGQGHLGKLSSEDLLALIDAPWEREGVES